MQVRDHTGDRFGVLTVLGRAGSSKCGHAAWLCRCDCGRQSVAFGHNLRSGHTSSCGCQSILALQASDDRADHLKAFFIFIENGAKAQRRAIVRDALDPELSWLESKGSINRTLIKMAKEELCALDKARERRASLARKQWPRYAGQSIEARSRLEDRLWKRKRESRRALDRVVS